MEEEKVSRVPSPMGMRPQCSNLPQICHSFQCFGEMCYQEAKFSNQMAECKPGEHYCEVRGGAAAGPQVGGYDTGWEWCHWKGG